MPTTYAIPDGRVAMAATLYTGNATARSISNEVNGVSMQPDFVWIKDRSVANDHYLFDSVRGAGKELFSNLTAAEVTDVNQLTAFNSNGFSLGTGNGSNSTSSAIAAWQWKAGGTAVSNTAGSITSSVSANTTAGFSVLTYTGTLAAATIGHGLGVAPQMIITKNRAQAGYNWRVYHVSIGATNYMSLNLTSASAAASSVWNNTTPTSTVFSVAADGGSNNTDTMVAYCFAPVAGYSAFGKYTGNGSAEGPFVYTNFRPRFVLIKSSSDAVNWYVYDTSRDTSNLAGNQLYPNLSNAEVSSVGIDILSNGFKVRYNASPLNASGSTHIYACFAENPFKFANSR